MNFWYILSNTQVDIMTSQPDYILGNEIIENTQKVLSIYGEITGNKKLYDEKIAAKIKAHILAMQGDSFFNENIGKIWGGISEKCRENLTSFMK